MSQHPRSIQSVDDLFIQDNSEAVESSGEQQQEAEQTQIAVAEPATPKPRRRKPPSAKQLKALETHRNKQKAKYKQRQTEQVKDILKELGVTPEQLSKIKGLPKAEEKEQEDEIQEDGKDEEEASNSGESAGSATPIHQLPSISPQDFGSEIRAVRDMLKQIQEANKQERSVYKDWLAEKEREHVKREKDKQAAVERARRQAQNLMMGNNVMASAFVPQQSSRRRKLRF